MYYFIHLDSYCKKILYAMFLYLFYNYIKYHKLLFYSVL